MAPIILMIGVFIIPVIHDVLIQILTDLTSGNVMDVVLVWLVHFLALMAFVGLLVFLYFFVKNKGFGLFE